MDSSVDKLIALAEEMDAKATSADGDGIGPWERTIFPEQKFDGVTGWIGCDQTRDHYPVRVANCERPEDAEFIAAARTAWPATAKALRIANDALRERQCDWVCADDRAGMTHSKSCEKCAALTEINRIAAEVGE